MMRLKWSLLFWSVLLSCCNPSSKQQQAALPPSDSPPQQLILPEPNPPPPVCELSETEMLQAIPAAKRHRLNDDEFATWLKYAEAQTGGPLGITAAWIAPDPWSETNEYAVAMIEEGCVVIMVHGFTKEDLKALFRGESIEGLRI